MSLRERYRPIALASNVLVITDICVLIPILAANGSLNFSNLAIGIGIILTTNLVFVASGMLAPDLMASGSLKFPLNVTLPAVFTAWGIIVASFIWRVGNPLEPTLEVFREFAKGFKLWEVSVFPIAQIVVMSVAAAKSARDQKVGENESP